MSWLNQELQETTGQSKVTMDAVRQFSDEELFELARRFPKMGRNHTSQYHGRLREAVIVVLYDRDHTHKEIAQAFALSTQRIQQIVSGYYRRMEQVWEQERLERQGL